MNPAGLAAWAVKAAWQHLSPAARQATTRFVVQTAVPVAAGAMLREISVSAQGKITEMEQNGRLSPEAAEAMRKTLRIVDVGASITVSAVGQSIAVPVAEGSMRVPEAVRDAVQNIAATAQTYVDGMNPAKSSGAALTFQGLTDDVNYIIDGEKPTST